MKRGKGRYLKLFTSTLTLSACTFGGGFVIIPLMKQKFVDELGWIDEEEMLDIAAIAQSSPGAIAVNASILVGYHVAGLPGALVSIAGTVLPPLVIISVISLFYQAFRDNPVVSLVMKGMLAAIAAVITNVVIDMTIDILKKRKALPLVLLVLVFILNTFLKVNIILLLIASALASIAYALFEQRRKA